MKKSLKETFGEKREGSGSPAGGAGNGELEELIGRYSGKSEAELMRELISETSRRKAEGTFDEAQLKRGAEAILPFLSEGQKQKLYSILGRL